MSDNMAIQQVLAQMRSLQAQAGGATPPAAAPTAADPTAAGNFAELLKQSVARVNELQQESDTLRTALELGDPNVSLPQVMIASEKASVAFQATLQVRNKLVEAYKEIMNMPV